MSIKGRYHLTGGEATVETREKAESFNCAGAGDAPHVLRTQVTRDTPNPLGEHAQVDQNTPCSYVSQEKKPACSLLKNTLEFLYSSYCVKSLTSERSSCRK